MCGSGVDQFSRCPGRVGLVSCNADKALKWDVALGTYCLGVCRSHCKDCCVSSVDLFALSIVCYHVPDVWEWCRTDSFRGPRVGWVGCSANKALKWEVALGTVWVSAGHFVKTVACLRLIFLR